MNYYCCGRFIQKPLPEASNSQGKFVRTQGTRAGLAGRLGERAEQQLRVRLERQPEELTLPRASAQLATFMIDGWQARYRGPGWGKKKTKQKRVEWHAFKTGVFYWHDQSGHRAGGRGG